MEHIIKVRFVMNKLIITNLTLENIYERVYRKARFTEPVGT